MHSNDGCASETCRLAGDSIFFPKGAAREGGGSFIACKLNLIQADSENGGI